MLYVSTLNGHNKHHHHHHHHHLILTHGKSDKSNILHMCTTLRTCVNWIKRYNVTFVNNPEK